MSCHCRFCFVGAIALVVVGGSLAFAQSQTEKPTKPAKPTMPAAAQGEGQPDFPLPPGWTQEDMMTCMMSGQPGPMQEYLHEGLGVWQGKEKFWMAPEMEPMTGEVTSTVTSFMDGRFTKCEIESESEMGHFKGFGLFGYDNVAEEFQSIWVDNHGSGIMMGKGERSSDGTKMTWTYKYTCPLTKKRMAMRMVETRTGSDSMTMEMHGTDPKSGKEFRMMETRYERKPGSGNARASAAPGMFSDKKAEAGCGLCSYHMEGAKSCVLAVKIDGKPYLVSQGANLVNVHQFCGAKGAKPAVVTGKIVDGKFEAKEIELSSATR